MQENERQLFEEYKQRSEESFHDQAFVKVTMCFNCQWNPPNSNIPEQMQLFRFIQRTSAA